MKKLIITLLILLGLIAISSPVYSGIARADEASLSEELQEKPLLLDVGAVRQDLTTSCGEAAILMAYNFVHPEAPLTEDTIIAFAAENEYYTAGIPPFTSPANMVKIGRHYGERVATGAVLTSNLGLSLLHRTLREGYPVIIDVRTRLDDPEAGAHFVLVTGLSVDAGDEGGVLVHYNDPLTGTKETSPWLGEDGIWNAWHTNEDPGGPGWWMVIRE